MLIRRGICTPADLHNSKRKGAPISCALLLHDSGSRSENARIFEAVISRIRLSNGVYRTTGPGRLADIDQFAHSELETRFSGRDALTVEDWACSDCLASAEWAERIFDAFPNSTFTASDILLHLVQLETDSGEHFFCEPDGALLQYLRIPFVIPMDPSWSRGDVVNRALQRLARRRMRQVSSSEAGVTTRELPLIHPTARELQSRRPLFRIKRHSIFESAAQPVHVLRTMNILNLAYFSPDQLRAAIGTVWASLQDGGIWIVGRTTVNTGESDQHNATIYEREREGFRVMKQWNRGTEIAELIAEWNPATVAPSSGELQSAGEVR